MARDFTAGSQGVRAGFIPKPLVETVAFWFDADTHVDGAVFGASLQESVQQETTGGTRAQFFAGAWSGTTGAWNFAHPTAATGWHHYVIRYSYSSLSNTPTVWLDGASTSVSLGTSPTGSFSPNFGRDVIGRPSGSPVLNGRMAEWGHWARWLTDREVSELYQRASALFFPEALICYCPLWGVGNTEPVFPGRWGEVVGSPGYALHPPKIIYPGDVLYPSPFPEQCAVPGAIASKTEAFRDEASNTTDAELLNSVNVPDVSSTFDEPVTA